MREDFEEEAYGVAKSSIFSARGAIYCHVLSLFFQRAKSSALLD